MSKEFLIEVIFLGAILSPLWIPILLISLLSLSKSFRSGQYYHCWLLSLFISSIIVFFCGLYIWHYEAHGATLLFMLSLGTITASIALNIFIAFILYAIQNYRDKPHA